MIVDFTVEPVISDFTVTGLTVFELWTVAIDASAAVYGRSSVAVLLLEAAAAGHPNARAIVDLELAEVTGCSCGEDEPCSGVETPERVAIRVALQHLARALAR
jgi:hypothetical protein